jgi:hypothetical protein
VVEDNSLAQTLHLPALFADDTRRADAQTIDARGRPGHFGLIGMRRTLVVTVSRRMRPTALGC